MGAGNVPNVQGGSVAQRMTIVVGVGFVHDSIEQQRG
jgi:hypothetical protein